MKRGILIFADDRADWKLAGLRQLDRLLLVIDDYANEAQIDIAVHVHSVAGKAPTIFPSVELRSGRVILKSSLEAFTAQQELVAAISTCLVPRREFLTRLFRDNLAGTRSPALLIASNGVSTESINEVARQLREMESEAGLANRTGDKRAWDLLRQHSDVVVAEKRLLRETSKSQDGLIARALNRPLSRTISRWLLHFPLSPNHWTAIFGLIALTAIMFLMRGDYLGFAVGAILFQCHSILDGCDGEMARVRYLQSESGRKLDQIFDRVAGLLFVVGLSIGLSRQAGISEGMGEFYLLEGIMSASLIGLFESFLTRTRLDQDLAADQPRHDIYSHYAIRNRASFNEGDQLKLWMIKHSGLPGIGIGLTSFVSQLTKRDVFNFIFMLIIVCGQPSWVLHIIAACACTIMVLALKKLLTTPLGAKQAPLP